MILVFDVGNTETVIGLFHDSELVENWRISTGVDRTVDELGLLLRALIRESGFDPGAVRAAGIGSVVPPTTRLLEDTCMRHLGVRTEVIHAGSPLPVRLDVDEPLTVGADRVVNTLAVARLFARDSIVVDLGTANTFDCITAEGVFLGGVIAPGVQSSAESLVSRTAKLPRAELEPPERVIGRRTETCLRSGIFYGAVAAIDGIVDRIRREWERPDALVVATGGLAPLVAPHCRTVERVEAHLTLQGLEMAYRHLAGEPRRTRAEPSTRADAAWAGGPKDGPRPGRARRGRGRRRR